MSKELKSKVYEAAKSDRALTIYAALSNLQKEVIQEVLNCETPENGQKTTPFVIAARNGHARVVKLLLQYFCVNIEQVGTVKFDGYVIQGATALWCAAGAGHFEVLKILVESKANVNHPTFSNSTPLRAACFDGRLDIVKYLVEKGADIQIPNKYNNTCLMIACYKGHLNVVRYLLECGANTDARAQSGGTALHFAAEQGWVDIVKELFGFTPKLEKNDSGLTPLHVAAESNHADIVDFFQLQSNIPLLRRIEGLELLGASYACDKDNYDIAKSYHYFHLAMEKRYLDEQNVLYKTLPPLNPAYNYHKECESLQELERIQDNHDALHMEALTIHERTLGENNHDVTHPIVFRGAVFADKSMFGRCIALWLRALHLQHVNKRTISKDMLRFAQVFSQMLHVQVNLDFSIVETVFEKGLNELERNRTAIAGIKSQEEQLNLVEMFESNIHTALYLLIICTKLKLSSDEELSLCKLVYQFNQMNLHLHDAGKTTLHMAVDEKTFVDDFHINEIVHFPNAPLVKLLIHCGASVNVVDKYGDAPLHEIARFSQPMSHFFTLHNIMLMLLKAGAHADMTNDEGKTAVDVSASGVAEVILKTEMTFTLKCLAARAVKHSLIPYCGEIPIALEEFVDIH